MANNPPPSGSQWPHPPSESMPPQNFGHPYPMQLSQGQQFIPPQANQQFHPSGQLHNFGMHHGHSQPPQFSQPMQQFQPRPVQPGHAGPPSHPQSNMSMASGIPQPQGPSGPSPGVSFSSSYTFAPSSFGMPQSNLGMSSHVQPTPQMSTPIDHTGAQPWLNPSQSMPVAAPLQQALNTSSTVPAVNGSSTVQSASDWQEFDAADGRRYYYNKTTKQSSWEKPADLMTPLERADASTVWKEFTTPEGRKYYYNKETKQSKWTIPDELKLARELAEKAAAGGGHSMMNSTVPNTPSGTSVEQPSPTTVNLASSTTPVIGGGTFSPAPVASVGSDASAPTVVAHESPVVPTLQAAATGTHGVSSLRETVVSPLSEVPGISGTPVQSPIANSMPMTSMENPSPHVGRSPLGGTSVQDIEEGKKGIDISGKQNGTRVEEKPMDDEPFIYSTKQEAKTAFKALLEFANVEGDWNWDQAMRVIINDKRYGALRTLGERKQAFNEYLMQRRKLESEEKRARMRKAKEEFMKMLEEAKELTSSTRWSKAVTILEDDKRFKAVQQETEREDLFRTYLLDLHKKEKAKAQEEYRRNRLEFRQFLESCAYIKVDSQWRKVQDLLEDDERCTRLDKVDRLDVFQDYIRDLEKEEDEQKKRQKEQLRRADRKNRDAFRMMMDEHISDGTLTAKTLWRDYCQKVKDSEPYKAVASNISGSTPKDLFEDVTEELEKKFDEDKAHIKDALKQQKITIASTWTFDEFNSSIEESIGSLSISDINNLQLVFEDLIDRAKEKEEKEAKKRKRLAKDFMEKLGSIKEINVLSTWEECKQLVEDSSEYRSLGEESLCQEAFDEYIARLQDKVKEKERKREEEKAKKEKDREDKEKRKDKDRREKERDKDLDREKSRKEEDTENMDDVEGYWYKDEKRRDKDKERKHRRRRHSSPDDVSSDRDDKEETKKPRRHGSDRKKPRKHAYSPESENENKHKRHKRGDHSRRSAVNEELEDGEVGEDGEIQ